MGFSKKNIEFFKIAKGSKFAVKCDWITKISQSVQNLGFFLKNRWVFWKKFWIFFKIGEGSKFALECVSNGIIS